MSQCQALTLQGIPCKNQASQLESSDKLYCSVHQKSSNISEKLEIPKKKLTIPMKSQSEIPKKKLTIPMKSHLEVALKQSTLPMKTVAIIGNARYPHFTSEILQKVKAETLRIITDEWKLETHNVALVSGGSSQIDHVAVQLWLENPSIWSGLKLYLPCEWDSTNHQFVEDKKSWGNPGRTLNNIHQQFSYVIGVNTLTQIEMARQAGAILDTSRKGFHSRNTLVAQSQYVLAFTWQLNYEHDDIPNDGGTLDTWKKTKGIKKHINLFKI
jgi:hypothetical protein